MRSMRATEAEAPGTVPHMAKGYCVEDYRRRDKEAERERQRVRKYSPSAATAYAENVAGLNRFLSARAARNPERRTA